MLNILVVDDEPKHRKGLSRMLKELKPEYNIFDARDGAEALERVGVHSIDLVFTDIQMPVMDGLEFVDHLTRRGGSESIVIMSAYSDFAYAQRALQLGANDYLLKPVDEQKVRHLLAKAEHQRKARRLASIESSIPELLAGENNASGDAAISLNACFPDFKQGKFLAIAFKSAADRKFLLCGLKAMLGAILNEDSYVPAFYVADHTLITLILSPDFSPIQTKGLESKLEQMIIHFAQEYGTELTIGLGPSFSEWPNEARKACKQACGALRIQFFNGGGRLYDAEDEMNAGVFPAVVKLDVDGLTKAVLSGNRPEISGFVELAVKRAMDERLPDPEKLKYATAAAIHHLTSCFAEKGHSPLHSAAYEEALLKCKDVDELKKAAISWILELTDRLDQHRQHKTESIIDSCKAYIERHYAEEDLSLSTLAAKFHFNPSYFCILFKNQTRMTLHQYIARTRMRAAADLLLQTSLRVYQIAENVGYKDPKYFIRLFRKEFGTSPEEYRHLSATR
ncbi:hypothetical protein J25TS5_17660 [Paenibacillus faecis]|uniref:response regulator transcription factor n=1 Tax=Paenibacillus faecis TaxID=862114 RepID=UPI001B06D521|nr:response regulator [Paenibacillus faecis]GIO84834.1 hypothetical protein J25TS5_17660 [Paenibacillus faecis]